MSKKNKIYESARGESCSTRIPGACNFNHETTVYAHAPCVDKGMGIKSPPWWGAYCCSGCHDFLDGRSISPYVDSTNKERYWLSGIYETQKKLREKGLIT